MRTGLKHLIVAALCVAIVFVVMTDGAAGALNSVQATKKDDLKNQNEQDQEILDELDAQVDELEGEQQGITDEIAALGEQIAELMASISLLEDEIANKKEQIVQAQADFEEAQRVENEQYEAMKVRIKAMYENGDINYVDALLSSSSMEELLNKADYIEKVHAYDQKMFQDYQAARQHVADVKEALEIEESELEAAQGELQEEMDSVEEARAGLELVSVDYAAQINRAQQQAQIYRAQIKQRNAEIKQIEEAERKAAEEEARRRAEEEARKTGQDNTVTTKPSGTATVNKEEILAANGSAKGKEIAIYACSFVGNPYVPGGTSLTNGADCSGFTQSVFKAYGYSLPRTSYAQRSAGREVSYAEAQPGDIICYPGHVAIYIGNGKIVHASSVKTGIKISNALYREIVCVRRIV